MRDITLNVKTMAKRAIREQLCNAALAASYLTPQLTYCDNIRFLLCFTLPNSGSTALAKILMSSRNAVALTKKAEGEWLVPSLSRLDYRWSPSHGVSMRKVRARWLMEARRKASGRRVVVIEKSPSNVARSDQILQALGPMVKGILLLTRDPYAICASWHRRYGISMVKHTGRPKPTSEAEYFLDLGHIWLERMMLMEKAAEAANLILKYEDLTADPEAAARQIASFCPELSDMNPHGGVTVKDYPEQNISNMNERQISTLAPEQIAAVSGALATNAKLVEKFGYRVRSSQEAEK